MIEICELCAADVTAIPAIEGGAAWHGGEAKWSKYWAEHQQGLRVCLVALHDGQIAGYGSLLWQAQHEPFATESIPEINDMVVAKSHRGRGIATAMIAAFEKQALGAGKTIMGIGVGLYADYGSTQQLYGRLGYVPDGSGVTYDNQPIVPGNMVKLDDDLVLWLKKSL